MTNAAQDLLQSFESLSDSDKREVAAEIVRRSLGLDYPPVSDEDLTRAADELFAELDRSEAGDGDSAPR